MIKLSVIVPCYNQGVYLSDCIESVLNQPFSDFEVIIVDDGSLDDTKEVAGSYVAKYPQIKYFYKDNGGLSDARNFGIKKSVGCYLLPLDADDKISNTYLVDAISYLDQNPHVKLVYCNAEFFGDVNAPIDRPLYDFKSLLRQNMIFCSAIYRREDYDCTEGYRLNMKYGLEDWDFWIQLLDSSSLVHKLDCVGFYYRIKQKSMFKSIDIDKGSYLRRQIVRNNSHKYLEYFDYNLIEQMRAKDLYDKVELLKSYKVLKPFLWFKRLLYN